MPARYWLVEREQVAAVSRLEAAGGVRSARRPSTPVSSPRRTPASRRRARPRGCGRRAPPDRRCRWHPSRCRCSTPTTPGTWRVEPIRSVAGSPPSRSTLRVEITAIVVHHGGAATTLPTTIGELLAELGDGDPPSARSLTSTIRFDHRRRRQSAPSASRRRRAARLSSSATRRGTSPSSRNAQASARRRDDEDPGRPRRPRGPVRTLATGQRADRLQPGAATRSRRHDPGGVPVRRRSCAGSDWRGRRRPRCRCTDAPPSGGPQIPSPLRLYGNRVMLRPLVAHDFGAMARRAPPQRGMADPQTAAPLPSSTRASPGTPSCRCTARERDAAAGLSFGFGLFVDDRICGEINVNHILRGALQTGTIGYWIDERYAGQASSPRESSSSSSSPSSGCGCTGRSTSSRATPTAGG